MNIVNHLEVDRGIQTASVNVTFGNTSQSATIAGDAPSGARFRANTGAVLNISGVSQLYPALFQADVLEFDAKASDYNLKWVDFQYTVATGVTNVNTITLDGDAEFDAFTVSAGDTLDLNGQRAEFSGTLTVPSGGALDADGMIIADTIDIDGTLTNALSSELILTGTGNQDWSSSSQQFQYVLVDSTGTQTLTATHIPRNLIVGSGTLDTANKLLGLNGYPMNLTIANGGILTAGSSTITVSEDWTSSGGLLGPSALEVVQDYVDIGSSCAVTGDYTIEAWIKWDGSTTNSYYAFYSQDGTEIWLGVKTSNGKLRMHTGSISSYIDTASNAITANKWYHVVGVWDGTNSKIYVDGKEQLVTVSGSLSNPESGNCSIARRSDSNGNDYAGVIDEVRLFNDTRTEAEIRSDMFKRCGDISDANEVSCWDMDEGTGTTVAD